jgi:hypothetical protein
MPTLVHIINRKIPATAITRIRHLPQKIGWRYRTTRFF